MGYDPDNIFARILRGEVPCVKVYEDAHTLAFMDVMPQTTGHTLVIPKAEATDLLDLPEELAGALLSTTQRVARAVKAALQPGGILVAQLNGAPAGQSVFHLHFHVIPREDGIDLALHARKMADMDALEATAARIRAAL
ncbi:MAG: histidine triad (HIT) family protein [Myxococcota bacterium]|jgi:histidine triad (HIT) family protein